MTIIRSTLVPMKLEQMQMILNGLYKEKASGSHDTKYMAELNALIKRMQETYEVSK